MHRRRWYLNATRLSTMSRTQTPPTAGCSAAGVRRAIPRRIHGARLAITSTAWSERRIAVRRPGVGPRSSKPVPEPTTRSRTVRGTGMSPAAAWASGSPGPSALIRQRLGKLLAVRQRVQHVLAELLFSPVRCIDEHAEDGHTPLSVGPFVDDVVSHVAMSMVLILGAHGPLKRFAHGCD